MKIVRFGDLNAEKPGVIAPDGSIRDLSAHLQDWSGNALLPASLARIAALDPMALPLVDATVRLGCPVARVRNVIAVGLNYVEHARETNNALPAEPILFNKHTATLAGPNDPLMRPPGSVAMDWEVELAVVIGRPAWHVSKEEALTHVAGYCLANDVSERDWQMKRSGQWTKGKSYPGWAPLGPWLLTADAVSDPHTIPLWLEVNGVRHQDGNTDDLNFDIPAIISAVSELMALLPGDVILTGTPAGVGQGFNPPIYLQAGDRVHVGSSILGEQHTQVVDYDPAGAEALLAAMMRQ